MTPQPDDRLEPVHPSDEWWIEPFDGDTGAERDGLWHADSDTDFGEGSRAS